MKLIWKWLLCLFACLLYSIWLYTHAQTSQPANTSTWFVLTGCIQKSLKITAYYSPELNQWVWFNGDYVTETKINGRGIHGASWKPVYNWMIAWPKKYPFWTTVSLPGIGRWTIYDRGSAIVSSGDVDRIDIWAWAGLQGMVNALHWGTKTISGTVCSGWLANGYISWKEGRDWRNYPLRQNASKQMMRSLNMEQGNSGLTIYYLNSFLQQLWYLQIHNAPPTQWDSKNGKVFWTDSAIEFTTGTKLALCAFQQDTMYLPEVDQYCGFYGTKTRATFASLLKQNKITFPQGNPLPKAKVKVKRMLKMR